RAAIGLARRSAGRLARTRDPERLVGPGRARGALARAAGGLARSPAPPAARRDAPRAPPGGAGRLCAGSRRDAPGGGHAAPRCLGLGGVARTAPCAPEWR